MKAYQVATVIRAPRVFVSPGHGQPLAVVVRCTAGEEIVDDGSDRIRAAEPAIQRFDGHLQCFGQRGR
jgi:hypothetical protein